jgi:hypothetical protein
MVCISNIGIKRDSFVKLTHPSLIITSIMVYIIVVAISTTPAMGGELNIGKSIWVKSLEQKQSIPRNQQVTATTTISVNLPIIEQNAPVATLVPLIADSSDESETELNTGTPTPTPIPAQTGSVNIPIVFGALAIILVIILAWFFVGYLPAKNKE